MFFTLKELVKWFGMTVFEMWTHMFTLLIFTLLAVLKHEGVLENTSWWSVFTPLFVGDGINAYFCVIVFIRHYKEEEFRQAGLRLLSSLFCFCLLFVFKFLLCQKLSWSRPLSYTEVIAPLFPMLAVLAVRSCQSNN